MKPKTLTRRDFLNKSAAFGMTAYAAKSGGLDGIKAASQSMADKSPEEIAQDEFFWREVQLGFKLDRTLTNLNNGFTAPCPRVVLEAECRYLELINLLPVHYQRMVQSNIETIRRRMAAEFGCEPEEMALTRGASESLQIAQNGLDLEPGDEVITTDQDYPRMLTTWDQRRRRDGIKVTRFQFPVPTTQDDLYQRFEKAITPKTKVFHFTHITNLDGPVVSGSEIIQVGALERHHYDRRRSTCLGAFPVQTPRPRMRCLWCEPAQVAASTDR